jgi:hypothetical protein
MQAHLTAAQQTCLHWTAHSSTGGALPETACWFLCPRGPQLIHWSACQTRFVLDSIADITVFVCLQLQNAERGNAASCSLHAADATFFALPILTSMGKNFRIFGNEEICTHTAQSVCARGAGHLACAVNLGRAAGVRPRARARRHALCPGIPASWAHRRSRPRYPRRSMEGGAVHLGALCFSRCSTQWEATGLSSGYVGLLAPCCSGFGQE